jgi:hypothetical protein
MFFFLIFYYKIKIIFLTLTFFFFFFILFLKHHCFSLSLSLYLSSPSSLSPLSSAVSHCFWVEDFVDSVYFLCLFDQSYDLD